MASQFRYTIPSDRFPAEKGRYILYFNYVCPWAHRAVIIRMLKGLEDVIQLVEVDARDPTHGWYFSGRTGPERDPVHGVKWLKELYLKADPQFSGRITIPILWDKQQGEITIVTIAQCILTCTETIVSTESADILRMLLDAFDEFIPPAQREVNKGEAAYIPPHLRTEIDTLNSWVYDTVNNGVYKVGFAKSQTAYTEHVKRLFESLDRLEDHLAQNEHFPYLFGAHITEADIRLFTTMIRFDVVYYTVFKCNLKMIRYDYPLLHTWLRRLYWDDGPETAGGAFKKSTNFDMVCYDRLL